MPKIEPPPDGYEVVRLPSINRYVVLRLDRDRAGQLSALPAMVRPDQTIRTFRYRRDAVREVALDVARAQIEALKTRLRETGAGLAATG